MSNQKPKSITLPLEQITDDSCFRRHNPKTVFCTYPPWYKIPFKHTVVYVFDEKNVGSEHAEVMVRVGHPDWGPGNDVAEILSSTNDGKDMQYSVRMLPEVERKRILRRTELIHWLEY